MRKGYFYWMIFALVLGACGMMKDNAETPPPPPPPPPVAAAQTVKDTVVPVAKPLEKVEDSIGVITVSLVGDLMAHMPQVNNARLADGTYNFDPGFEYVKPYLAAADFTIGNLETTCAGTGKPYAGYPAFNSPDAYVTSIKNTGFDLLVTSNNHSMDTGEEGLLRTIDVINQNGLSYTGTHKTQRDRDSVRVYDIKGIKLGVLNYTYGTNGAYPRADHKYMMNVIDTSLIQSDIVRARKAGAEIVLVFYHYGIENIAEPTKDQQFIVNKTMEYGADIIIGAHPHVVGPASYFTTVKATLDTGFVAYSLGNFYSNQNKRYTDAGVIVNIQLEKNFSKRRFRVSEASFIPTWVYRGTNPSRKMHIIFPSEMSQMDSLPAFLDKESKDKMAQAFDDTKAIMMKYSDKVKVRSIRTTEK